MKRIRRIVIGSLCCFLILWIGSLLRCEVLTHQHYDEFKEAYKQNPMLGEMEYFKVLEYKPYRTGVALVYYVSKENTSGDVLAFRYDYEKDLWQEISWVTIWSGSGGSASEVIWPYWWHFIYGGL